MVGPVRRNIVNKRGLSVSESTRELIASILRLAPVDRAIVADAILASLDVALDEDSRVDVSNAWSDEIRSRLDDINSGRVKMIPSAEAWKMIDGEIEIPD